VHGIVNINISSMSHLITASKQEIITITREKLLVIDPDLSVSAVVHNSGSLYNSSITGGLLTITLGFCRLTKKC